MQKKWKAAKSPLETSLTDENGRWVVVGAAARATAPPPHPLHSNDLE